MKTIPTELLDQLQAKANEFYLSSDYAAGSLNAWHVQCVIRALSEAGIVLSGRVIVPNTKPETYNSLDSFPGHKEDVLLFVVDKVLPREKHVVTGYFDVDTREFIAYADDFEIYDIVGWLPLPGVAKKWLDSD